MPARLRSHRTWRYRRATSDNICYVRGDAGRLGVSIVPGRQNKGLLVDARVGREGIQSMFRVRKPGHNIVGHGGAEAYRWPSFLAGGGEGRGWLPPFGPSRPRHAISVPHSLNVCWFLGFLYVPLSFRCPIPLTFIGF